MKMVMATLPSTLQNSIAQYGVEPGDSFQVYDLALQLGHLLHDDWVAARNIGDCKHSPGSQPMSRGSDLGELLHGVMESGRYKTHLHLPVTTLKNEVVFKYKPGCEAALAHDEEVPSCVCDAVYNLAVGTLASLQKLEDINLTWLHRNDLPVEKLEDIDLTWLHQNGLPVELNKFTLKSLKIKLTPLTIGCLLTITVKGNVTFSITV